MQSITSTAIVEALQNNPTYTKIFTLSRPQKREEDSKIKHATLDLQASAEDMSKQLSSLPDIDHVFFCAYLAKDDEGEADRSTAQCCRILSPHWK